MFSIAAFLVCVLCEQIWNKSGVIWISHVYFATKPYVVAILSEMIFMSTHNMLWGERLICFDFVVVIGLMLLGFFLFKLWSVFCLFFQKRGNFPIQNLFCFIQKTKLKLAIFSGRSTPKGSILLLLFFHGRHISLCPHFKYSLAHICSIYIWCPSQHYPYWI